MKSSPLKALRQSAKSHPAATRRTLRGLMFGAAVALLQVTSSVRAQTSYTWASSTAGGAWTTPGNWTPNGVPGTSTSDTATLGDVTANSNATGTGIPSGRTVTLNTSETIAALTVTQNSAFTNELTIQPTSTATTTLTVSSALSLSAATNGTSLLFLDATGNTKNAQYSGDINLGNNGVVEMSAYSNGTTTGTSNITGAVTVGNGTVVTGTGNNNANLNVEVGVSSANFAAESITGNLTLQSGGTITLGKTTAPNGVTLAGTSVRFTQTGGNFLASGGTINAPSAAILQFAGTSATFDSGVTGTFFTAASGTSITLDSAQSSSTGASIFTLASNISLPTVTVSPNTNTNNVVNMTLGSVTSGNTLTISNLSLVPGFAAGSTKETGALEVTLGSNVTIGNTTETALAGSTVTFNLAGFTFTNNHNFGTPATASSFSIQGNGSVQATGNTLSAQSFTFTANTGTGGTSVGPGVTLLATGGSSTIANNLGSVAGSTIDPTSTFQYTGTATGTSTNTLTSNRAIGGLIVGSGTSASILNLATANLSVGAGTTVNTNATLDLNGFGLTQAGANAAAGGLSGGGTVRNNAASTAATLALNVPTGVTSTFTGTIVDNSGTGGTVALTTTGAGTQILSGTMSTYSGGTMITGGTLLVNSATGSGTGAGAVLVAGGTLGGTGQINAGTNTISIGGTPTGGTATGGTITGGTPTVPTGMLTLTTTATAGVIFNGTSTSLATYLVNINGANSSNLAISGALTLTGAYDHITISGTPTASSYDLIYYTGALTGTFTELAGDLPSGYQLAYVSDEIELVATPVPEPSTWLAGVFSVGIAGFAFNKRRHAATVNGASAWAA